MDYQQDQVQGEKKVSKVKHLQTSQSYLNLYLLGSDQIGKQQYVTGTFSVARN